MQSAFGTLLAAIQSKERYPLADVDADWRKDDTWSFEPGPVRRPVRRTFVGSETSGPLQFLTSVTIDRSLSTDLPDAPKTVAGFAAAEATSLWPGHWPAPDRQAARRYDIPLNTLAPGPVPRSGPASGCAPPQGAELLRAITGRSVTSHSTPGTAP